MMFVSGRCFAFQERITSTRYLMMKNCPHCLPHTQLLYNLWFGAGSDACAGHSGWLTFTREYLLDLCDKASFLLWLDGFFISHRELWAKYCRDTDSLWGSRKKQYTPELMLAVIKTPTTSFLSVDSVLWKPQTISSTFGLRDWPDGTEPAGGPEWVSARSTCWMFPAQLYQCA